jgi:tetratricopeptide (TPR) repeat protein
MAGESSLPVHLVPVYLAQVYNHRGGAHYRNGDYDRAIADFTNSIDARPGSAAVYHHAYYSRGLAFEALGRNAEAGSDYRRALESNPSDKLSRDALKRLGAVP